MRRSVRPAARAGFMLYGGREVGRWDAAKTECYADGDVCFKSK